MALDPVNFEKPYTRKLEGVSTVHKSTPTDRHGKARLAWGYLAITATVVNTRVPATTYAGWLSYKTGFIGKNREIHKAIGTTRQLFPIEWRLRFVVAPALTRDPAGDMGGGGRGVRSEQEGGGEKRRTLVLLTSVRVEEATAQALYNDRRLRGRIEHGYRFCQEQGLGMEDMRVRSLESMRRLFVLVLLAAQFVMHLAQK